MTTPTNDSSQCCISGVCDYHNVINTAAAEKAADYAKFAVADLGSKGRAYVSVLDDNVFVHVHETRQAKGQSIFDLSRQDALDLIAALQQALGVRS